MSKSAIIIIIKPQHKSKTNKRDVMSETIPKPAKARSQRKKNCSKQNKNKLYFGFGFLRRNGYKVVQTADWTFTQGIFLRELPNAIDNKLKLPSSSRDKL